MNKLTNVLSEEELIKSENEKLRNPLFGGFTTLFVLMTDDHSRHIRAHLKYWYNPITWLHIYNHYSQLRLKRRLGIENVTTDVIVDQLQNQTQAQQQEGNVDPNLKNTKKPQWH